MITAEKTRSAFRLTCSVTADITAPQQRIWQLLVDLPGMKRWNSTLASIEGTVALGERICMRVPDEPKREFKVKVVEYEHNKRMVWRDGFAPMFVGARTYELKPQGSNTRFSMTEVFSGLMVPLIAGKLPDFQPIFERYAADLKREAERV